MQRASHSPIATQLTDSRSRAKTQASQHLNGWVEGIEQTHWKQRWAGGSEPGPRPTSGALAGGGWRDRAISWLCSPPACPHGPCAGLTFPRYKQSSQRSYGKHSYPRGSAKETIFERLIILTKNLQETRHSENNSSRPTFSPTGLHGGLYCSSYQDTG